MVLLGANCQAQIHFFQFIQCVAIFFCFVITTMQMIDIV